MIPLEQIHPLVVHFPIVFFLSLAVLDTVALFRSTPIDGRGSFANLSAGLAVLAGLAAVAAYSFGDAALEVALASGINEARLETHELLGTTTAIVLGIWGLARAFIWWRQLPISRGKIWGVVFAELAVSLLIIITAYYGGQLVYDFGVNVASSVS
jgi:uncharacterized membrane protein